MKPVSKIPVVIAAVIALSSCSLRRVDPGNASTANRGVGRADSSCTFAARPTVVKRDGNSILQFWTLTASNTLSSALLPQDSGFADYRFAIRRAGADLRRPIADEPRPQGEDERQLWAREERNVELAYSGRAGHIRPIQCLEALLFAYQNARYPQLTHPTEFISSILRKRSGGQTLLKVYFAASGMMFPPKGFYGFDEIEPDLTAGWEFWMVLHNHTVQKNKGGPALGVPAPSTSDVDLLRSLAKEMGLQSARITNGFFTIEIPSREFGQYVGR